MQDDERAALQASLSLRADAELLLGSRAWFLVCSYGKLMDGPDAGLYVSGIVVERARVILSALAAGEQVPVHLMHRHRSGNYESSALRFENGKLVMVFKNRVELA